MNVEHFRTIRNRMGSRWRRSVRPVLHTGVSVVTLLSLGVTGAVTGMKMLGWMQPLELRAYDTMVQHRPHRDEDPRLLIVAVTEADIRTLQRATPSDASLAEAIAILSESSPRAIGIDLYREVPQDPGHDDLLTQLQRPNVVAITKLGDAVTEGILPPPGVPPERVGFNDLLIDPDGVVRRSLLFATTDDGSVYYAFALRLALAYLAEEGIGLEASPVDDSSFSLNGTSFIPLESTDGGYHTIDSAGYQLLLNYRSPRSLARQVTFSEVLARQVDPAWIEGNVILIGTTAPSGKDLFQTPYSSAETRDHLMPGVTIHGHMVSQILSAALDGDRLFRFMPSWGEGLVLLGWTLLGGTVAWCLRHPLILGVATIAIAATIALISYGALHYYHLWLPSAASAIGVLINVAAVTAGRASESQRKERMVMTLLGQNASPEIAAALWKNRDALMDTGKLPGQTLTATILFSDIKHFSRIAEAQSPDRVLLWLNEYLDEMTQSIQEHQGIVNKFTGDGLIAVFGVPVGRTTEDEIAQDARHAVRCALDMSDRLRMLNQAWQARDLPECHIRIGIFTGNIIAGSLGGKNRLEYGVIGDSVNIASRLESCCKDIHPGQCRILIAEETRQYLDEQFDLEDWGGMLLRGREQTVQVYRVVVPSTETTQSAIAPLKAESPTYTKIDVDSVKS